MPSKPLLPEPETEGDDESDKHPLEKMSKQQKKEELERKDRWIKKFEIESREINERSVGALTRAQRCIKAMDDEINEQESSYSKYKTAVQNLDKTCYNKITKINARERSLNRFVFGRSKPADLDKTYEKLTWPNHGWIYPTNKRQDYSDLYTSQRAKSTNKTAIMAKPRRAVSNAKPIDRVPKEIRAKIEENQRALRERVDLINYMQN